ncbi:MAG: hypothetical protein J7K40_13205 [candidate division Zixibacteria bacterium]|nr:hypothetical protein [candidate division Zixibacteria bacterium]
MAKKQTFADKAKKLKNVKTCSVCNSPIIPTLFLIPNKSDNGFYKYKKNMVNICKCNHKEYYG